MEFVVAILCGPGRNLDLVVPQNSSKALLPIANKAMLDHVLEWCERANFAKILCVAHPDNASAIEQHLNERSSQRAGEQIEVVAIAGTETGDVIAGLATKTKLSSDFVLMPCDFITDADPAALVSAHRLRPANTLATGFYYRNTVETLDKKTLAPAVLLHSSDGKPAVLLDAYPRQTVKDHKKLNVRMQMLWRYPAVSASTDILYAAIYFCRREVLELVRTGSSSAATGSYSVDSTGKSLHLLVRDFARRSWCHSQPLAEVGFELLGDKFLRANNMAAYLEANRQLLALQARQTVRQTAARQPRDKTAPVIGNDAIVDSSAKIGERSSVKRTAVGPDCVIGTKCRLTGCVLLAGVVVENDVVLENCIVGAGAKISSRVRLQNCQVEGNYAVQSGTEAKNEALRGLSMRVDDDEYADLYSSMSSGSGSGSESESGSDYSDASNDYEEEIPEGDDFFDRS